MKVEKKKKNTEVVKPIVNLPEEPQIPNDYHEISGLPSKGKLYNKEAKIYARALKILEIKQLTNMDEENYGFIIDNVLQRTTILHNLDYQDMLIADKLFIIFWQRANTYQGDGFSIDFACSKCIDLKVIEDQQNGVESTEESLREASVSKYDFSVENLQLTDIKEDYNPNTEIELKGCGSVVTMFQHTVATEKVIGKIKMTEEIPNVDLDILNLASVISSIDGKPVDIKTAYAFIIDDITPPDFIVLEKYKTEYDININPSLEVTCKKCGGEVEAPLTFRPDFFLP